MLKMSNLPGWERALRLALGGLMMARGAALWGKPLALALVLAGCFVALTAAVAWCPVCAIAGRRRVER